MRRFVVFIIVILNVLWGVNAQESLALDNAIRNSIIYLTQRLPHGTMVIVFGFNSQEKNLSDYIMDQMMTYLVNEEYMRVIDRQNQELLRQELNIQMSGNVDDELAHSIGKQFGADIIITGSLTQQGAEYRMQVRAINVETAQIHGLSTQMVRMDSTLASFMHKEWVEPDTWKNKRVFLGIRGGSSLGFYNLFGIMSDGDIDERVSFDFSLQASVQINDFFAVQAEFIYAYDSLVVTFVEDLNYQGWARDVPGKRTIEYSSLIIPLLAKYTYRPSIFSIQGFGGIYFSIPFGKLKDKVNYDFSWQLYDYDTETDFSIPMGIMVGGSFGVNIGPGSIFTDIRYVYDLGNLKTKDGNELYQRSRILLSIGYEIGIMDR
jgi:primosomal replication protein N